MLHQLFDLLPEVLAHDHVEYRVQHAVAQSQVGEYLIGDVHGGYKVASAEDAKAHQDIHEGHEVERHPTQEKHHQHHQHQDGGFPFSVFCIEAVDDLLAQSSDDLQRAVGDHQKWDDEAQQDEKNVAHEADVGVRIVQNTSRDVQLRDELSVPEMKHWDAED